MKYTDAHCQWLKENAHKYSRKQVTEKFNQKFGTDLSVEAIKSKTLRMGLNFKPRNDFYTAEQNTWLKENAGHYTREELTKRFNEKFKANRTPGALKRYCVARGYYAPTDGRFQKGNIPWKAGLSKEEIRKHYTDESWERQMKPLDKRTFRKIGDTVINRVSGTDYPYVLVEEPNGKQGGYWERCVPKSRYIWEQHHGKVPDGCVIVCLDGNQMNTDIDNLALVKNEEKIMMTSNGWWNLPKEAKKTALTWCKLRRALNDE